MISINSIDPEIRTKYEGIVNQPINGIYQLKGKPWFLATYPTAMGIYSTK